MPPPGTCWRDRFEDDGLDGWSADFAGTAQRTTDIRWGGAASMELTGTTATARRAAPNWCAGTLTTITFRARSSAASQLIFRGVAYDSNPPVLVPARDFAGPYDLTTDWQLISIAVNIPQMTTAGDLHIEVGQASGVSTYIDDVLYIRATSTTTVPSTSTPTTTGSSTSTSTTTTTTTTTTTSTPTTVAPTSAPPTSAPDGTCQTDTFDAGLGGWTTWWNGHLAVADQELRLTRDYTMAAPVTASRVVLPTDCPTLQSVTFDGGISYGRSTLSLYVKTVDLATGSASLFGPYTFPGGFAPTGGYPEHTIPVSVGERGVMIGIEVYSSASQFAIDNVRYERRI
jgi:hypothetical protein